MSQPPVIVQPPPPTPPSRFWRRMTILTLAVYVGILLIWLGLQVAMLMTGQAAPPLALEDATDLAIEQADRILGLLEVVLGIIGLLLPLGLGVVVYIYNQSRATIEENRVTIARLSEQAASATRDAARSADIVESLRAKVADALRAAEEAVERDKERDTQTQALQRDIDKQRKQIDVDRIDAEMRDKKRDEQTRSLQDGIEEQWILVTAQREAVERLQTNVKLAYEEMFALRRQMKVVDIILIIREYEVTLLSEEYDTVFTSLNTLIHLTDIDEDDDENIDNQHIRRREATHALATLCHTPYQNAPWFPPLLTRAIQHLENMAQHDPVISIRAEARRALRDFNGALNGKTVGTAPRGRKPKSTSTDSPTNAD